MSAGYINVGLYRDPADERKMECFHCGTHFIGSAGTFFLEEGKKSDVTFSPCCNTMSEEVDE